MCTTNLNELQARFWAMLSIKCQCPFCGVFYICMKLNLETQKTRANYTTIYESIYTASLRAKKVAIHINNKCACKKRNKLKKQLDSVKKNWATLVSTKMKEKIHLMFHEETSTEHLIEFTCASYTKLHPNIKHNNVPASKIYLQVLCRPDDIVSDDVWIC